MNKKNSLFVFLGSFVFFSASFAFDCSDGFEQSQVGNNTLCATSNEAVIYDASTNEESFKISHDFEFYSTTAIMGTGSYAAIPHWFYRPCMRKVTEKVAAQVAASATLSNQGECLIAPQASDPIFKQHRFAVSGSSNCAAIETLIESEIRKCTNRPGISDYVLWVAAVWTPTVGVVGTLFLPFLMVFKVGEFGK